MNNKQAARKGRGRGKKIFLGVFLAVGSIIIILAAIVLFNLLFSKNVSTGNLTKNTTQFLDLYNENNVEHNLPDGIEITQSTCRFDTDTYTITVKLKCTERKSKPLELQIYYNQDFEKSRDGLKNPFVKVTAGDNIYLSKGDEREFKVTGTLGKNDTVESLKETLSTVYLELIIGKTRARIIVPMNFTE